jgi:hypothetical protein
MVLAVTSHHTHTRPIPHFFNLHRRLNLSGRGATDNHYLQELADALIAAASRLGAHTWNVLNVT